MGLSIRFVGGAEAGQVREFGDDVELIAIGRDPAKCQVVFPPDQTQVGREHCGLKRVLGRYRVVLNEKNVVLINGKPALDDEELPDRAELQLGKAGPRLQVERAARQDIAATLDDGQRVRGKAKMLRDADSTAKSGRRVALLAVLLLVLAAAVTFMVIQTMGGKLTKTGQQVQQTAKQAEETEKKVTDIQTTLEQTKNQTMAQFAGMDKKVAAVRAEVNKKEPSIRKILTAAAPSVYLVTLRDQKGNETPMATAWCVLGPGGKKALATNVHVAMDFGMLQLFGQQMMARPAGNDTKVIKIESVKMHPGAEAFARVWAGYEPVLNNSLMSETIDPAGLACDVALMFVDNPDDLTAPLSIATDEEVQKLEDGSPIGLVGFPLEGMTLGGVNLSDRTPAQNIGHITSITDYFGVTARDPNDKSRRTGTLVQHSIGAAGGCSGSPVLNEQGKVIAILSGGNVIGLADKARIGSSSGINFAQRIDLLRELIEETDISHQNTRDVGWDSDIKKYYASGRVKRQEALAGLVDSWSHDLYAQSNELSDFTASQPLQKDKAALEPQPNLPPSVIYTWHLPGAGRYMVASACKERKALGINLSIVNPGPTDLLYDVKTHDRAPWLQDLCFRVEKEMDLQVRVSGTAAGATAESFLYQATEKPLSIADRRAKLLENWRQILKDDSGGKEFQAKLITLRPYPVQFNTQDQATGNWTDVFEVTLPDDADYLAFASSDGKRNYRLAVSDGANTLAIDETMKSLAHLSFTGKKAHKIRIVVATDNKSSDCTLCVYRAVPNKP